MKLLVIYTETPLGPPFPISKGVEVVVELSAKFETRNWLNVGGVFESRGFAEDSLRARKTRARSNFWHCAK